MTLNIIDIASSLMRSVNQTVFAMSEIALREMPAVANEPVPFISIKGQRGTFLSIIHFSQKDKKWTKGVIVITLLPEQIQKLFSKNHGISTGSTDADIMDVCGEFCNVVEGGFKKELLTLGFAEVMVEPPESHFKEMSKKLELMIHNKYQLTFNHQGVELLQAEMAMESPD